MKARVRRPAVSSLLVAGLVLAVSMGHGLLGSVARAQPTQSTTLTAVADTTVRSLVPYGTDGSGAGLSVTSPSYVAVARSLVRFDQAAIAGALAGKQLISATIELRPSSIAAGWTGGTIGLHRMTMGWTEVGATWSCADDTFTGAVGDLFNNCTNAKRWGMSWFSPYPRPYTGTPSAQVQLFWNSNDPVTLDVTADITSFLAGSNNHGWALIGSDSLLSSLWVLFGSRESVNPPRLILTYRTPPPPSPPSSDPVRVTIAADTDTYVTELFPDANRSTSTILRANSEAALTAAHALVRFDDTDISAALSAAGIGGDYELTSATLIMTVRDPWPDVDLGHPVDVHRMVRSWDAARATWRCTADTSPLDVFTNCAQSERWNFLAPNPADRPYEAQATTSMVAPTDFSGEMPFNVGADVHGFLRHEVDNFGWLIRKPDSPWLASLTFFSSESGTPPRLELEFRKRTCNATSPCNSGQGSCTSDVDCRPGLRCGANLGWRFGYVDNISVCWDERTCTDPSSPRYSCGSTLALCGLCPDPVVGCTPDCTNKDCGDNGCFGRCGDICEQGEGDCTTSADCAVALVCGVNNGPRFGFTTNFGICWSPDCELPDPDSVDCGTFSDPCGTCPSCSDKCNGRVCGTDACGVSCGTCPTGLVCHPSSGQCLVDTGDRFPLPPDAQVQNRPVGTLPGSLVVTPGGDASYTIPLDLPPGRHGVEPSLSLRYNSSAGESLLGVGWSLDGFSAISRCPRTAAIDGFVAAPKNALGDQYCLDGQPLVPIQLHATAFPPTIEYRTSIESFTRVLAVVTFSGEAILGPHAFFAQHKDGRIFAYGQTENSTLKSASPPGQQSTGPQPTHTWLLDEIRDRTDATAQIRYVHHSMDTAGGQTREYYPEAIYYGGLSAGQQPIEVGFFYRDRPWAAFSGWRDGFNIQTNKQLEEVFVRVEGELTRRYRFSYEGGSSPSNGSRRRLRTVQDCNGVLICKPPTTIDYEWPNHQLQTPFAVPGSGNMWGGDNHLEVDGPRFALDLNGDGIDDFLLPVYGDGVDGGPFWDPDKWIDWWSVISRRLPTGEVTWDTTHTDHRLAFLSGSSPILEGAANLAFLTFIPVYAPCRFASDPDRCLDAWLPFPGEELSFNTIGQTIDWNNDGREDILRYDERESVYTVFMFDGATLQKARTDIPIVKDSTDIVLDANGDGLDDLLSCVDKRRWLLTLHDGATTRPITSLHASNAGLGGLGNAGITLTGQVQLPLDVLCKDLVPEDTVAMDMDGDGSEELLIGIFEDGENPPPGMGFFVDFHVGESPEPFVTFTMTNSRINQLFARVPMDVNGDGLLDLVNTKGKQDVTVAIDINRGDGFFALLTGKMGNPNGVIGSHRLFAWDANADGRDDLVIPEEDGWKVALSSGGGFGGLQPLGPNPTRGRSAIMTPADIDGDGKKELAFQQGETLRIAARTGPPRDLMTAVTNGLGARSEVSYASMSSSEATVYEHGSFRGSSINCHYPHVCARPKGVLVTESREFDVPVAPGVTADPNRIHRYFYHAARTDALGRGALGFRNRTVTMVDPDDGAFIAHEAFHQDIDTYETLRKSYPGQGKLSEYQRDVFVGGEIWSQVVNYHYDPVYPTARTVYGALSVQEEEEFVSKAGVRTDLGATSSTIAQRDSFGNVLLLDEDLGENERRLTGFAYKHQSAPAFADRWLVGLTTARTELSVLTHATGTVSKSRSETRDYLDNGLIREAVRSPGNSTVERTTTFDWSPSGSLDKVTQSDAARDAREIIFDYDEYEHYPTEITNDLGQTYEVAFDRRFGHRVATQDPNMLLSQAGYDDFGRLGVELAPDGSRTTFAYSATPNPAVPMTVEVSRSSGARERADLDVRGRTILGRIWGLGGEQLTARFSYGDLGTLETQTRPTAEARGTSPVESFVVDNLGRVGSHTGFDGKTDSVCFVGPVSCNRDARGFVRCAVADAQGRVRKVTDPVAMACEAAAGLVAGLPGTTYEFGPFGDVEVVRDAGGSTMLSTTDDFGRVTAIADPDLGTTTFTLNGFDEVVHMVSGRSLHTDFEYDGLGRLELRRDVDARGPGLHDLTTYEWDGGALREPGELVGLLTGTHSPQGVEQRLRYAQNSGRLLSTAVVVDGAAFETSYAHDALGRLHTVQYPAGPGGNRPTFEYRYDSFGHLLQVTDEDAPSFVPGYWNLVSNNPFGQIDSEVFRNGVTRGFAYFPDGKVFWDVAQSGSSFFVFNELRYDDAGNLQSRRDLNGQLETFAYDGFGRLAHTTAEGGVGFSYDLAGNLYEGSVDQFYLYNEPQPHALSTDGTHDYGYDGSGNRTEKVGPVETTRYAYTPFEKIERSWVEGAGGARELASYQYDAFTMRVRSDTPSGTTTYGSDLYERRSYNGGRATEHIYYISNGERIIAQITWPEGGTPAVEYVHDDPLGSTQAISPSVIANDADIERFSYTAFGQARDPDNWASSLPAVVSSDRRIGYTGHETDFETELVNMGGRIYDPATRQFMSPDPFMQSPFGEGLNRFSYVFNNPLRYIDPSGYLAADSCHVCDFSAEGTTFYYTPPRFDFSGPVTIRVQHFANQAPFPTAPLQSRGPETTNPTMADRNPKEWGLAAQLGGADAFFSRPAFKDKKELGEGLETGIKVAVSVGDFVGADGMPGPGPLMIGVLKKAASASRLVKIGGQAWRVFRVGESACIRGCGQVASAIQKAIGGKIVKIEGPPGTVLGRVRDIGSKTLKNPAGDSGALGWANHEVVVKDGRVFDALTGPEGQALTDYASRWEYPDFILEALVR